MRGEWPFVGRPRELLALRDAITDAGGAGAILVGPAGVGKTRLAAAALAAAADAGFATERVTATESSASLAFGALASLLPPRSLGDRTDLLRQAADALAARGDGRTVVLMVDDVHLLDPGSAALIHQVATIGRAVLLATLRSGASPPEEITALWKDQLVRRIEVGPLDDEAVAALLQTALDGPVARPTIRALQRSSGGSPLYLRELVLAASDDGRLQQLEGVWQLNGPAPLPSTLVELVRDRLDALARDERPALELIAFGEPVEVHIIEQLTRPGVATRLEQIGLLTSDVSRRRVHVRLAHPIHGEVIRTDAPYLAARRARSQLSAALEACGARRREDAVRVCAWRLDAGEELAPDLALAGATQARARSDLALAERCAVAAVAAGAGLPGELALAEIVSASGRSEEGEKLLVDLASRVTGETDVAAVATAHFDNLIFLQGRYADGFTVAAAAESKLTDLNRRAELTARRAFVLVGGGFVDDALALVDPLLDEVTGAAAAWCGVVIGFCCVANGRLSRGREAVAVAERAINEGPWGPALPDPAFVVFVKTQLALYGGHLAEAEALAIDFLQGDAIAAPDQSRAWLAWSLATIARLQGRPRTAARRAQQALALFRAPGPSDIVGLAGNELALARAVLGDAEGAAAALAPQRDIPGISGVVLSTELAEAWILAAQGRVADAASLVGSTAEQQHGGGTAVYEALVLVDLARLGRPRPAASRLAELAADVEGGLVPALARFAQALASGDPAALDGTIEELAELGLLLHAAEAATAASVAHRQVGNRRMADAAAQRAADLTAQCQGARTPGLVRSDAAAALSPREREAAGLAVAGLSNREIADRLGLSKRTVDNALQRVYDKLGLAGRPELAEALGMPR